MSMYFYLEVGLWEKSEEEFYERGWLIIKCVVCYSFHFICIF